MEKRLYSSLNEKKYKYMLIIMFQTKILALHSLTFEPHEIQQFVSPLNTLWRGYLIVHTKFGDSILAE